MKYDLIWFAFFSFELILIIFSFKKSQTFRTDWSQWIWNLMTIFGQLFLGHPSDMVDLVIKTNGQKVDTKITKRITKNRKF